MTAFLGISVWVTLAMVVPGLVTMAVLFGAMAATGGVGEVTDWLEGVSEWVVAGMAVTCMIMTQAVGILLESLLVRKNWLGPERRPIVIPPGIDPLGEREFDLQPYEEYQGLYLLLAELREGEDSHGHLQRALAQFFLSNNTIVSFSLGILVTLCRLGFARTPDVLTAVAYLALLYVFLLITVRVSRIRFEVMTKALWAARRRRLEEEEKLRGQSAAKEPKTASPRSGPTRVLVFEEVD